MKKIYLYPLWIRIWHLLNALMFIILITSGISLHYSESGSLLVPFSVAIIAHNVCGVLLSLNYLFYFIFNLLSGNYKHYIPKIKGFIDLTIKQAKYYLLGIFIKDEKPFHPDKDDKFNPIQKMTYLFIMFVFMPLIVISGWLLMFPGFAPDEIFGMGGVWPMALLHTIVGFFLSLFFFGHIYLGTTGKNIGELYQSIITGWHLAHEEEHTPKTDLPILTPEQINTKKRLFPVIFYNPLTVAGTLIGMISLVLIIFLMLIQFFIEHAGAYIGIVTFVILPFFLIIGILTIAFGAIKENRRLLSIATKTRVLPVIDLNNPKHQIATIVFTVGIIVLAVFSVVASFKAYEYTDSDEFCGTVCHKVMHPDYTAYQDSPHSRVGCVKCHINTGSGWLVRSKLSGTYQIFSTLLNKFPKPLPTPIVNLRPSPETCEQCHWTKQFYSEKNVKFDCFLSDENNTESKLTMLIKTGGGSVEFGNNSGIHWNMYLANEVTYMTTDKERQIIPWVKTKNKETGKETIYQSTDFRITDEMLKPEKLRKMDCIDCHNRPSHQFHVPNKLINAYMSYGRIDRSIPYIKNISVQALESYAISSDNSYNEIRKYMLGFYEKFYPNVIKYKKQSLEQSIEQISNIFQGNYFPKMKVSWRNYQNNIGHLYSNGCYRCHDGKHVSPEGKVISNDCNVCHTIISQKAPWETETTNGTDIKFLHPGGTDKIIEERNCPVCHAVKR
ncbi:MAG: hypothetical protein QG635_19 [Bacteroidota bacterium]|nr:hypothetical protein [Bacteroidota bacterium]